MGRPLSRAAAIIICQHFFLQQISYIPITNKKPPKSFRSRLPGSLTAKYEPRIAPKIPQRISLRTIFFSMFPCLICDKIATIAVGTKESRFTLCAICWGVLRKIVNAGIRIVPPPIPIPLIMPDRRATKIISIYNTILIAAAIMEIPNILLSVTALNLFKILEPI